MSRGLFMVFHQVDSIAIAANSWIRSLKHERTVGSTNTLAAQLIKSANPELPLLVLADAQTAGRGRGENVWWSSEGSLTFSLVFDRAMITISPLTLCPLAVGCVLADTVQGYINPAELGLKWPNDVMLGDRKVAGILLETSMDSRALIIGIGVNVNCDMETAPAKVQAIATSISHVRGRPVSMSEFLNKLLGGLRENLIGGVSAERILESYRRRNYLAGRPIAIARGDQSIAGVCAGIGDNGAILLQTDEGVVAVASGSVELSDGA